MVMPKMPFFSSTDNELVCCIKDRDIAETRCVLERNRVAQAKSKISTLESELAVCVRARESAETRLMDAEEDRREETGRAYKAEVKLAKLEDACRLFFQSLLSSSEEAGAAMGKIQESGFSYLFWNNTKGE